MRITAHKTNSMYGCYRIVDEHELRQAQEQQQAFLKNQTIATKVVPLQNRDLDNVLADSKRYSHERIRIQDGFRAFIRHATG
jgi:hypothetical protein